MKIMGWIRVGDKAACGGTVTEGLSSFTSHGIAMSYEGAAMECPHRCHIAEAHPDHTLPNGRHQPHHGHKTLPGMCPLISTLNNIHGRQNDTGVNIPDQYFQNADGKWTGIASPQRHEERFDEQAELRSTVIQGVPYFIETMDGRSFFGRVSAHGMLPRIDSFGEDEYTTYWGDEALAKIEGTQS